MSEIKKLTYEEWQKEYGLPTVIEYNTDWFLTREERDMYERSWKEQEQKRYERHCKAVDVLNLDPHDNKTYAEVMEETKDDINNTLSTFDKIQKKHSQDQIYSVISNLNKIEEKNRCIRVRMFDWLSDLFSHWSEVCHEKSVKIDSPCAIKLPRKEEKLTLQPTEPTHLVQIDKSGRAYTESIKKK